MQRKCGGLICSVLNVIFSSSLYADMGYLSPTDGWYVEGTGGGAYLSSTNYPRGTTTDRWGGAGNVDVGYKFFQYVAAEMGYSFYSTNEINNSSGTEIAEDSHYAYYLALRGIYPLPVTGLEGFAKLGMGRMNSNLSIENASAASAAGLNKSHKKSAMGGVGGLGVQYYFLPQVAALLAWQVSAGDSTTGTENLFSIGLSAIFS